MVSIQTNMLAVNGSVEAARAANSARALPSSPRISAALARDFGENAGRIKDTVRAIQDQIAAVRRELEQISSAAEAENQRNVTVLASLSTVETDMSEISTNNQQILANAETILSSVKEAARGAQQVAAAAEEAGSAAAQAATAAKEQARGRRGSCGGDRGNRVIRRRNPESQWLGEASARLRSRPAHSVRAGDEQVAPPFAEGAARQHLLVVPDRR